MIQCKHDMGQKQVYKRNLKPRQLDFIQYYTSPKSDTYSNAVQSAIAAGYASSYAHKNAHKTLVPLVNDRIQQKEERLIAKATQHERMLAAAEAGLEKDLSIDDDASPALRAIRNKTGTFIAETIGKSHYSKQQALNTVHVALVSPNTLQALEATMVDALGATPQVDTPVYTIEDGDDD